MRRPGRPVLAVSIGVLMAALAVCAAPERLLTSAPKARALYPRYEGVRLVRNDYDRDIYADRGSFLRAGRRPYRDTFSEYPVLATYLFGLPWSATRDLGVYRVTFTLLMALTLVGMAGLLMRAAARVGASPWRAAVLLLPGTLYFSLNFFDAAPACASVGAVLLLLSGRFVPAHALLGVAFLLKAYPLVYLPAFVVWTARIAGWRIAFRALLAFAGVIAACALQLATWAGAEAVVAPFRHQMRREDNAESLYHVMVLALPMALLPWARAAFLGLQALPGLAVVAARLPHPRVLLRWLVAATLAFVLFSRFQSPQWVVWITPLAALAASARGELLLVIAQDVAAYLYFPLAYDRFGPTGTPFAFAVGAVTAIRLLLLFSFLWPHNADAHGRSSEDP